MIVKVSKRQKDSNYKRLTDYITRPMDNTQGIQISNCGFDTIELAVKEIEATQEQNTRTKSDKTYHLIVSFHSPDLPKLDRDTLNAIEKELCKAIGYEEHQRISAFHTDTEHPHLHLAVNKIHPESGSYHETKRDFLKLQEVCKELERKFSLVVDEHENGKKRANNMEAHTYQESFCTWIDANKAEISQVVEKSAQWPQLHKGLSELGLGIKTHGNGLVLESLKSGEKIKLSTIEGLSKKSLEAKFGQFEAGQTNNTNPTKQYQKEALKSYQSSDLWSSYVQQKEQKLEKRKATTERLKTHYKENKQAAYKEYQIGRELIKKDKILSREQKQRLYKALTEKKNRDLKKELGFFRKELAETKDNTKVENWQAFLVREAQNKNEIALAILRRKPAAKEEQKTDLLIKGRGQGKAFIDHDMEVNKNGNIHYFSEKREVIAIDTKQGLKVADGVDEEKIKQALMLAKKKFGKHLKVEGSSDFIKKATELAKALEITIDKQREGLSR